MEAPSFQKLIAELERAVENATRRAEIPPQPRFASTDELFGDIRGRLQSITDSTLTTTDKSMDAVRRAVECLKNWMVEGTVVRILGAGRARLAASVPANRLAHGGARVYIQDDIIPMPHSIKGGGIIAVSASGQTESVLGVLRDLKKKAASVQVIGIARHSANEFRELCERCGIFIGIQSVGRKNPLQALADTEEYVISMLLDAMVVAAGKLAGFDDTTWRLGHEDLGATGPWDVTVADAGLRFDAFPGGTAHQRTRRSHNLTSRFLGRSKPVFEAQNILFGENRTRVLAIHGESGCGKTALAYELARQEGSHLDGTDTVMVSAYGKPWSTTVAEIAQEMKLALSPTSNLAEIEAGILATLQNSKTLLIIDDIPHDSPALVRLIVACRGLDRSRLLLTTDAPILALEHAKSYHLNEPLEDFVVDELLGSEMAGRIRAWDRWDALKGLSRSPQRLLYLQWSAPETEAAFDRLIQDLGSGQAEPQALEAALRTLNMPAHHFVSLGHVRVPEVDEGLLAHLWDRLGLGGAEGYARCLRQLAGLRLVALRDSRLRLGAHVHVQLGKHLSLTFAQRQSSFVHYFIGEFYRQQFARPHPDGHAVTDLERYVYHTIESGHMASAYGFVFGTGALEAARAGGLSVELPPLLEHFSAAIAQDRDRRNVALPTETAIMWATVKLEIARVRKDLSRHKDCLQELDEAIAILQDVTPTAEVPEIGRLMARLLHHRAIAFSQIGRTRECVETYAKSIQRACDFPPLAPINALSLGYLAYEMKFHDIAEAERLGRRAVDLAAHVDDSAVKAKNLCSLALIQAFYGRQEDSRRSVVEAELLSKAGVPDRRELGRILVNGAVTFISMRDWAEAEKRLTEAVAILGNSGDRRRRVMSQAYQGILLFHQGNQEVARALILSAFQQHQEIGAVRETLYEALTYGWMMNAVLDDAGSLGKRDDCPDDIRRYLQSSPDRSQWPVFEEFWREYYAPTLLTFQARPQRERR